MPARILHAATRAAYSAAASQVEQCDAVRSAFSGNVTLRIEGAGGQHLRTMTLGPFTVNTATPRGIVCGSVLADTAVAPAAPGAAGIAPTRWEFRNGSTPIFDTDDITQGPLRTLCSPRFGSVVFTSNPLLPVASPPFAWGTGTETGSLVGDVWTPGRQANGKVNQVSWNLVPTGRWIEVAGTRIDTQLTTAVQAVSAGWDSAKLWGTTPGNSIFQSWSCFGVDEMRDRFWFLGGGHSDGYNNGLYRFDCQTMRWSIECPPSAWSDFSVAYRTNGSATNHPDATATAVANFNANNAAGTLTGTLVPAVNGPMYDQIPLDGKPTARHTYESLAWAPDVGSAGSLFMHARRLWRYDMATGTWAWKRLVNDQVRSQGNPAQAAPNATNVVEIHAAEASLGVWDEVGQRVLCSASGSNGAGAYQFNWSAQTWAAWSGNYGLNFGHAAQARHGRITAAFTPPYSDSGAFVGRYWRYDLDTNSMSSADVQLAGGLTLADFVSAGTFYDGEGMVYVPPVNRYWVCTRRSAASGGGMQWLELDPTTTPWTLRPRTFTNAHPVSEILIGGRVRWMPNLHAVLVWDHCFANAFIYRF